MDLNQPIFFIGMPRSGTTIIFEAFSTHTTLGWLSNYTQRFPAFPHIALIHRLFGNAQGRKNQSQALPFYARILPEPMEVYNIWNRVFGSDFSISFLKNETPSHLQAIRIRNYLRSTLRAQGRERLCIKFTGPPRVRFLTHIFPEAYFIDILRDPRAVISSLFRLDWWKKNGLEKPYWTDGLGDFELAIWEQHNRSPVALAALLWRAVYTTTVEEVRHTRANYQRIQYEDFIRSPSPAAARIASFCGLRDCPKVNSYITRQNYVNMNDKYSSQLTKNDIATIEAIAGAQMRAHGYLDS